MFGWTELVLWGATLALIAAGVPTRWRSYRSLLWASAALALITSAFPRPGNGLGQMLFGADAQSAHLPSEIFGIAWWLLGAWLANGILDVVLRKTLFPRDNQPHARRLFADLVSILLYVIAFVGIMETVLKQPISAVLATSGVLAIVLGLALQSTLGDIFSGLAINVDRPFGAGDWITLSAGVEGEILEINWRATRIRTWQNDIVVIPNSVVAKAIVTNHSMRASNHFCTFGLTVDNSIAPSRVISVIEAAANTSSESPELSAVTAYASSFGDAVICYQVVFPVDEFENAAGLQSNLIARIATAFIREAIPVGAAASTVRILRAADDPSARTLVLGKPVAIPETPGIR